MATNSTRKQSALQPYPRRSGSYVASDELFPRPKPLADQKLQGAIKAAFERTLRKKTGTQTSPHLSPVQLVAMCLGHLQGRSDPILNPSFLSQCKLEEVFEMDAIAHEMQRHRMKIGNFYQFLVIELMKTQYKQVYDGKREGDVEAELETPKFSRGLRLFISVKKSGDTVGGQDIGGVFSRLEKLAKQDKNLTRPYMGVVAVATPPRGVTYDYESSRSIRCKDDGSPYSPNCEVWYPGFIYPFVCGREAGDVYKEALKQVANYLPFNTL
ncbi:MAG: hypothetical protein ABR955_11660, partial [Verrucomicrobiota bacterium]